LCISKILEIESTSNMEFNYLHVNTRKKESKLITDQVLELVIKCYNRSK